MNKSNLRPYWEMFSSTKSNSLLMGSFAPKVPWRMKLSGNLILMWHIEGSFYLTAGLDFASFKSFYLNASSSELNFYFLLIS